MNEWQVKLPSSVVPAWGDEGEEVRHFCPNHPESLETIHRQEEVWANERGGWVSANTLIHLSLSPNKCFWHDSGDSPLQPQTSYTTPRSEGRTASTGTLLETTLVWSRDRSCGSFWPRGSALTLPIRSINSIAGSRWSFIKHRAIIAKFCPALWHLSKWCQSDLSKKKGHAISLLFSQIAHSSHFLFLLSMLLLVHQERFDLDPQRHLPDWSREGEEGARERPDKGGPETKTGVWEHQQRLSQVGLALAHDTLLNPTTVTFVVAACGCKYKNWCVCCSAAINRCIRSRCCAHGRDRKWACSSEVTQCFVIFITLHACSFCTGDTFLALKKGNDPDTEIIVHPSVIIPLDWQRHWCCCLYYYKHLDNSRHLSTGTTYRTPFAPYPLHTRLR